MGEPNPFDVLDATKDVVRDLNRALYGDTQSRIPGLFDKVDALSNKLDKLSDEIKCIERRRPHIANWVLGYITFCLSVVCGMFAVATEAHGHQVGWLPLEVYLVLSVLLALAALLFFLTGFGWIGGNL